MRSKCELVHSRVPFLDTGRVAFDTSCQRAEGHRGLIGAPPWSSVPFKPIRYAFEGHARFRQPAFENRSDRKAPKQ
jgi:hypothetical protein